MYRIVADSGCDIFELEGASFGTVPLTISTDTEIIVDDETLNVHDMTAKLLAYKGRSFTACPSTANWIDAFNLEDGSAPDELYIVTLTSGLSGTFNSANVAKDIYVEQHPDTKAVVIDSLSVGPEMRLILEKLVELKREGCSFEEICGFMPGYVQSARLFFAFKSLHNLAQNGRVSKLAASAAGVLGISVYGTASSEGQIEPMGKTRGDSRVVSAIMKCFTDAGYKGGKVRIIHVENEELAGKLKQAVLGQFPGAEVIYYPVRGLCAYYVERGGIVAACETD